MRTAKENLDIYYQEMRWRALSLAADLDRIERSSGSDAVKTDPRLQNLKKCFEVLLSGVGDRAAKVQMILSDLTPPPTRNS